MIVLYVTAFAGGDDLCVGIDLSDLLAQLNECIKSISPVLVERNEHNKRIDLANDWQTIQEAVRRACLPARSN